MLATAAIEIANATRTMSASLAGEIVNHGFPPGHANPANIVKPGS
jgi:hypothetical protein